MTLAKALALCTGLLIVLPACAGDGDDEGSAEGSGATNAESESSTEGESESESSGGDALVDEYCTCMLFRCHGHYHELWGEDEMVARAACFEVAAGVPQLGEPTTVGDALECRLAWCEMSSAEDDPAVCPAALGGSPCDGA